MSITVRNLIDRYAAITENSEPSTDAGIEVNLNDTNGLNESEQKLFTALALGVVTEKVLKERRAAR
jgi:hypothetical protein